MKNFFFITLFCFSLLKIYAQDCINENFVLATQEQVDGFPILYPDCTQIDGSLTIGHSSFQNQITDLSALSQITGINDDLIIKYTALTDLTGLEQITHVDDFLRIEDNPMLINLVGLDNLADVRFVYFEDNSSLENLAGLENVDSVTSLTVISCDNIQTISHLSALEHAQSLRFSNNPQLSFNTPPIPLSEVEGYLTISTCSSASNLNVFSNLRRAGSGISLSENIMDNVDGLEQLDSCGLIEFVLNSMVHLDALSNLSYVGDLYLDYNYELADYSGLDHIETIHGDLTLDPGPSAQDSILRNLQVIEGNLDLRGDNFQLLDLSDVLGMGGNLLLSNNNVLTDLALIAHFDSLGGGLSIENMRRLNTLDGFAFPAILNGDLRLVNNDSLRILQSVPSLRIIIGDLYLERNVRLNRLRGLDSLMSVDGLVHIESNGLQDLNELSALREVTNRVFIYRNGNLRSLSGLGNVDLELCEPDLGQAIRVQQNYQLSNCAIRPICDLPNHPDVTYFIGTNANGCNNLPQVENDCMNASFGGYVFYDFNGNGLLDVTEAGIDNAQINILPEQATAYSNSSGYFSWLADSATNYTVSLAAVPNDLWVPTPDTVYTFTYLPNQNNNYNKNFPLTATQEIRDGNIVLSSNPTRCNTDVGFVLHYSNNGTLSESGEVQLRYDESVQYLSASPSPASIDVASQTLTWSYSGLDPFQSRDIDLVFRMPDETATGNLLHFSSFLWRTEQEDLVLQDSSIYQEVVLCSYDPNDKLVLPMGVYDENYTLHDQTFTYTVRFQNTGNAEAINISIYDTISPLLDIATFKVINSSFPVQTSIKNRAVEFYFENIWLPDSTSNEPASHGFVIYEIDPLPDLDDFSVVANTAFIVFDFNPAIVTNTTRNTMVTMIPTSVTDYSINEPLELFPNPVNDHLKIVLPENRKIRQGYIYNSEGAQQFSFTELDLTTASLLPGFYTIIIYTDEGYLLGRFIKM